MILKNKYNIGEIVEMANTEDDTIRLGSNKFINISKFNRFPNAKYPKLARYLKGSRSNTSIFDWKRNPNWNNVYKYPFVAQSLTVQGSDQTMESNRKTDGNFMFVIGYGSGWIVYGSYGGPLKKLDVTGAGNLISVFYNDHTDSWFFGDQSGKMFTVSDSDLALDVSPTLIVSTPVSGFTGSIKSINKISGTNTMIFTNSTNEIARSTDDGVNWTNVSATTTQIPGKLVVDNSGNILLGTSSGYFWRSVNDGVTWTAVTEDVSITAAIESGDFNPTTGRSLLVGRNVANIFAVDDMASGNVYTLFNTSSWADDPASIRYIGENTWICTHYLGIGISADGVMAYISTDDGVTWSELMTQAETEYFEEGKYGYPVLYDGVDTFIYMHHSGYDYITAKVREPNTYVPPYKPSTKNGTQFFMCVQ